LDSDYPWSGLKDENYPTPELAFSAINLIIPEAEIFSII
jgi:hypothetical protein